MHPRTVNELTVLYDENCGFCCECAAWLAERETVVEVRILPRGSAEGLTLRRRAEAQKRACHLPMDEPDELLVIDDHDHVYEGPAAFILCLWAIPEWQGWAVKLSQPGWRPYARRLFAAISKNRTKLAWLLGQEPHGGYALEQLPEPIRCA